MLPASVQSGDGSHTGGGHGSKIKITGHPERDRHHHDHRCPQPALCHAGYVRAAPAHQSRSDGVSALFFRVGFFTLPCMAAPASLQGQDPALPPAPLSQARAGLSVLYDRQSDAEHTAHGCSAPFSRIYHEQGTARPAGKHTFSARTLPRRRQQCVPRRLVHRNRLPALHRIPALVRSVSEAAQCQSPSWLPIRVHGGHPCAASHPEHTAAALCIRVRIKGRTAPGQQHLPVLLFHQPSPLFQPGHPAVFPAWTPE